MAGEINEKQIQQLINILKVSAPERYAGLSDEEILSIYNPSLKDVQLDSDDKISLIRTQWINDAMGLSVERIFFRRGRNSVK